MDRRRVVKIWGPESNRVSNLLGTYPGAQSDMQKQGDSKADPEKRAIVLEPGNAKTPNQQQGDQYDQKHHRTPFHYSELPARAAGLARK